MIRFGTRCLSSYPAGLAPGVVMEETAVVSKELSYPAGRPGVVMEETGARYTVGDSHRVGRESRPCEHWV